MAGVRAATEKTDQLIVYCLVGKKRARHFSLEMRPRALDRFASSHAKPSEFGSQRQKSLTMSSRMTPSPSPVSTTTQL